jgi:hypothetical protein
MGYVTRVEASKAKCKRHRDNWKERALAYKKIIEEAKGCIDPFGESCVAWDILNEADKIMEGK